MGLVRGFARRFGETSEDNNATQRGHVLGVLGVPFHGASSMGAAWLLVSDTRCHPCSGACIELKGDAGSWRVALGSRVSALEDELD
jgi:hypothetical protein